MKYFTKITMLGLILLAGNVFAQDEEEAVDYGWNGKGELGYVSTSGNTDSSALNLALEITKNTEHWSYRFAGTALVTSKDGDKDTERYSAELQANRNLDEKSYILAVYRYDADKFGAYDPAQSVSVGYGRVLMKSEKHTLKGEIGAGYQKLKERVTGITESQAIARLYLEDSWQIFPTTSWDNNLLVEAGSDNTFTLFNTGVVVSMTERFALKVGWQYRHNSTIPPGTEYKTDYTTSANLVYNF